MTYAIGALLGAILYRMGGMEGLNTKFRDFGVPAVFVAVMYQYGHGSWQVWCSAALLMAALTTYWDTLCGEDNMYLHGLGCGLAMIPMAWAGVPWYLIALYAAALALLMGGLNTMMTRMKVPFSDWVEELFRGAVIIWLSKILWMWR